MTTVVPSFVACGIIKPKKAWSAEDLSKRYKTAASAKTRWYQLEQMKKTQKRKLVKAKAMYAKHKKEQQLIVQHWKLEIPDVKSDIVAIVPGQND